MQRPQDAYGARLERRKPLSIRRKDGLLASAKQSFSQNGEDGILDKIFSEILTPSCATMSTNTNTTTNTDVKNNTNTTTDTDTNNNTDTDVNTNTNTNTHINTYTNNKNNNNTTNTTTEEPNTNPHKPERWCVDVGAWDGKHLSNTHNLLTKHTGVCAGDWKGCLLEADKDRIATADEMYTKLSSPQICIHTTVGLGDDRCLDSLLAKHAPSLPKTATEDGSEGFCFLSIDVDGFDYWIWEGLKNYKPAVVCIEFNPTIPNHIVFTQAKDENIQQGSSLAAIVDLAENLGYKLVETTIYNAFFALEHLYSKFVPFLPGASEGVEITIDVLHECSMTTDLFQLYDGNLCIAGCKKMLWHRVAMNIDNMQVLPKNKRGQFPFAPNQQNKTQSAKTKTKHKHTTTTDTTNTANTNTNSNSNNTDNSNNNNSSNNGNNSNKRSNNNNANSSNAMSNNNGSNNDSSNNNNDGNNNTNTTTTANNTTDTTTTTNNSNEL